MFRARLLTQQVRRYAEVAVREPAAKMLPEEEAHLHHAIGRSATSLPATGCDLAFWSAHLWKILSWNDTLKSRGTFMGGDGTG